MFKSRVEEKRVGQHLVCKSQYGLKLMLDWVYIRLLKRISLTITNQTVKMVFDQKQTEWIQPESRSVQTTFPVLHTF